MGKCLVGVHLCTLPLAHFVFHIRSISVSKGRIVSILLSYINSKFVCTGGIGSCLFHFGQTFKRWFSLSRILHVEHEGFILPLKLFPHSSIPYLAIIVVLHSFFVICIISCSGVLEYSGCESVRSCQ